MDLSASDRVLVISPLQVADLRALAGRVSLVVCIIDSEHVYDVRAALRDCQNMMIVPAGGDGVIPWTDSFFSVVHTDKEPGTDVFRVLTPEGRIVRWREG